jgi:hypothetical protein
MPRVFWCASCPEFNLNTMSRNYDSDSVLKLIHRLRVFLKVFLRYLAFPLRLVHHLCRTLLRFYYDSRNIVSRRRFRRIHPDGHTKRVAGSSMPTILLPPSNGQLQIPQSPKPASCSSSSLLPVYAPPSSSSHVPQSPPVAPANSQSQGPDNFEPFTPSDVMRYDKPPSM